MSAQESLCGVEVKNEVGAEDDIHEDGDDGNIKGERHEDGVDAKRIPYDTIRGFLHGPVVKVRGRHRGIHTPFRCRA